MLFRPTIASFFSTLKPETHRYMFLALVFVSDVEKFNILVYVLVIFHFISKTSPVSFLVQFTGSSEVE